MPDQATATETAEVCFPVHIRRTGRQSFVAGETVSLSLADMLVNAEEAIPIDTDVEIEIVLGRELPPCPARVAGHEARGLRLRYADLPPPVAELIGRLLRDQLAFGDYAIEALIGIGGMAEVYRALATRGPHKGRIVAVKRLRAEHAADPEVHDFFLSEADLGRMLDHPGIIEVIETAVVDDVYFIAMEHLEGGSIGDLLRICRQHKVQLPIDFCCYVVGLVANALEYTHSYRGPSGAPVEIVHCDATPSNILIAASGEVKLTYFGVAHVGSLGAKEGTVMGKAPYQPPEQILGGKLTPESDIFALSAVLYEMLTNTPAFDGDDVASIHQRILRHQVRPPEELRPEIPQGLSDVIMQGLAPDRACDRLGFFTRLWRRAFGRQLPKRIATAAEFGARVRGYTEPLYSAPDVVRVVVNKLRELQRLRPLFTPLASSPPATR